MLVVGGVDVSSRGVVCRLLSEKQLRNGKHESPGREARHSGSSGLVLTEQNVEKSAVFLIGRHHLVIGRHAPVCA